MRAFTIGLLALGAAALAASGAMAQNVVGFATLPAGAVNNVQAQVIAKVVQQNSDLQIRVTPYRGTTAVASAVDKRQAEFGITDVIDLTDALNAKGAYEGRAHPNLRVAFRVLAFPVAVFVRKDSDIKTIADLKGKRFPSEWTAFSNGVVMSEALLATAGLGWKDIQGVPVTNIITAANDFKADKNDAFIFAVGAPLIAEVDNAVGGVRVLSISEDSLDKVKEVRPDYFTIKMNPAPPFVGVMEPSNVLGSDLTIYVNAEVSDEIVYKFVKGVHGQKDALVAGHPTFRAHVPELMAKQFTTAKYHPGAIKFFKEVGLWKE